MATLRARLFGKCCILLNDNEVSRLEGGKAQELFCYLLLHADRPHAREHLASLLWGDSTTVQSKKYLRQTLWQLQTLIETAGASPASPILATDADWVRIHSDSDLWIDVAIFNRVFATIRSIAGADLDDDYAQILRDTARLYCGDLLEGWYYEWCLFEREQLQNAYLTILHKLMGYCEAHRHYEDGIDYGSCILRYDCAHERTHRHLMRLYYLAGDRTGALRQYQRCCSTLNQELNVRPSQQTIALYQQIRGDMLDAVLPATAPPARSRGQASQYLSEVLQHLYRLYRVLADTEQHTLTNIAEIEFALDEELKTENRKVTG